ncbi:MAG: DUF1289 domain-containing protein [Spirochaetia bacterium]|nr:DUF1289 domain-containing protein [Spirochaetia bacterium]
MIESPCIDVCIMDDYNGMCRGCLRTLEEIENWSRLSDPEKSQLIELIEERKSNA